MNEIKINKYQTIFYFVWDNKEETIDMVNEYLKITKDDNWSCARCVNDGTQSNASDVLYISKKSGDLTSTSYYYINDYVIDFVDCFRGLKKEEFDKGDFIEQWKQK